MKSYILLSVCIMLGVFVAAQSLSPSVISSAGEYFEGTNVSLSWTLGEIATETYSNGSITLTQGFQQPFGVLIQGIDLDVLVYLEGPFSSGNMSTDLRDNGFIPLAQPYNMPPWNYPGTESVASIPSNVVDWVIIDLRDASSAATATPSTSVEMKAAFLLDDGSVRDVDGSSILPFSASLSNDPYIVVWHRNHLGILSANALTESGGTYTYDFSSSAASVYGGTAGYKLIDTGIYGMAGGDANGDGMINSTDKNLWEGEVGTGGYTGPDHNMDVQVNNQDKNDTWVENTALSSQVPD